MQFVHASSMQRKIGEDCYDVPLQCDMWINAELIRTIEIIEEDCFAYTKDGCYLIDGFCSDMEELFRTGFKFPELQKGE